MYQQKKNYADRSLLEKIEIINFQLEDPVRHSCFYNGLRQRQSKTSLLTDFNESGLILKMKV